MFKRPLRSLFVTLLMIAVLFSLPAGQADAQSKSIVRVWLKRLQITDTLEIEVQGNYMLKDGSMTFTDGSKMTVVLRENQLVLHAGPIAAVMGKSMELVRCDGEVPGALRLNGNSGQYEGDLYLTASDDVIRPVLHIFVEDYLLGVVPYEMGDSFPLEALKAQAIAARTYVLKKTGESVDDYDVEDTTNDQAYRGRSSSSPLSEQAVRETEGLCGVYNNKLASCYYSASNGGQTELGQHVWPKDDPNAYAYMDMRDDPYDYENDASVVKRFTLSKRPDKEGIGPALHSALVSALEPELRTRGYEAADDLVVFDEIISVDAMTPKYESPSRLMTELRFDVRISVRECLFRDTSIRTQSADENTPAPEATATPTPKPTSTPAYSPYKRLGDVFTVTLPVFGSADKAMGLSINVSQNELLTVSDIGSAFMFESRRFGHGVGMSQRGAEQMARKYNKTYEEILEFYYPTMSIMLYSTQRAPLPTIDRKLMATPVPTPSPTPRPTMMPVTTKKLPRGAYVAVVSNISEDSSLNLRESPSLGAEVLRRLYKDQKLIVLKTTADGWAHVKTDVIEGYVRSEYLQTAGK